MKSKREIKKSNNSGLKIIPGMCCAVDVLNESKLRESETTHVVAIRKLKHKLFRNSIWEARDLDDPTDSTKSYTIEEYRLFPENVSVIRYPDDMPVINSVDIDAMESLIKLLDDNKAIETILGKKKSDRVRAVLDKLKYYQSMREL